MSGSTIRSAIKAIVILILSLSALTPLGVKASGLAISGSFGQTHLTLIAGERFRDDSVRVTLINPGQDTLTLRLDGQGPSGLHFTFEKELVILKGKSSLSIPISFELSESIAPGTYPISVTATIVSETPGISVSGYASLSARLTVMGEAGRLRIRVTDVRGAPFDADLSIVRIEPSGHLSPCASTSTGRYEGRLAVGTYRIQAKIEESVVAEETIELQDKADLDLVLIARPIFFSVFVAGAVYDTKGVLSRAGLAYTITNLGPSEPEVQLIVTILRNGKALEDQELMTLPLISPGPMSGRLNVLPQNGFDRGRYKFSLRLISKDGILLAQSVPQGFGVNADQPWDFKNSLWLLPGLIGAIWKMTRKKRPS